MRKIFGLLFGLAFLGLLSITTLALSLRSFVFNAEFYIAALESQGVFQKLEQNPLEFIDLTTQIPQLASIPAELQRQVVITILPPGWLEKQATSAVQAWLAWVIAGEGGLPEIPIDLRQIRDRLQGPPGLQVADEVVGAIPACARDQQAQLAFAQLPECLPAVFDRNYIVERVAQALNDAASRMPIEYDIGPRLGASVRLGPTFNGQRIGGTLIDSICWLLALSTLGMWVLSGVIGGRTGRERWSWLGGLLLAGSLLVLGLGLFIYLSGPALVPTTLVVGFSNEVDLVVQGLAQALLQNMALRAILTGGVSFIFAFALLGMGIMKA